MVVGKPPALTVTQAYFCAVMDERRLAGESVPNTYELALKFNCCRATIQNTVTRKYTKHYRYGERA